MKLKHFIIVLFSSSISLQLYAQTPGFVQQDVIKVGGITTDAQIYALPVAQKQTTRTYYDGLGRTVQAINVQASPLQNDLIQPVVYDNLGRQTTSYMGYAGKSTDVMGSYRPNAISTDQPAFYNQTTQYLIATDADPFTQQVVESSPLQRLLQAGMVGNGYQPVGGTGTQHYKTVSYRFNNTAADGNILVWNPDGTFTASNYYTNNSLRVTDGKDEDNTETLSYTDQAGRTVLKRQILSGGNLDTYYVYNNAGMLIYTIPPLATTKLAANSYNLSGAPLKNLVFFMVYDNMGRLIEKTVPAKGTSYIVYDPLNRPVLVQDANMLANNQWNYIKYDAKGRAISQGLYTDNTTTPTSHIGRVNMQAYVNSLAASYNTTWYESRTATFTNNSYYSSTVFPTSATGTLTPLAYGYYDDYNVNNDVNNTADFFYAGQTLPGEVGATTAKVKGMPTITCKTTVGSGLTATWLTKVIFYDKRGNPIQTKSNNHVYYTGIFTLTDVATSVPDFMGMPQVTKVSKQTGASTTTTEQTTIYYDHEYRVLSYDQSYNGGASTKIVNYSYNEVGQVVQKSLGWLNPGWLQVVDMRYNIRGQLLSINNSKLSSDAGVTNNDSNDLFGMQFLYDQVDANLGNSAYFNGKLSGVKWMSKDVTGTSSYERGYKYTYDGVNRFTTANYKERTAAGTGTFSNNLGGFDESGITYDAGGNIGTLIRNSSTQGTNTHIQIDNLTYTYNSATNPNQLLSVTDGTDANHTGAGFRNLTGSTSNYTYDTNGNLTADPYKGLTIAYDYLNRTDKITVTTATGRYINYTYDAGGTLIRKQQYDNNILQTTTEYIDGFVYISVGAGSATLSYLPMPEGRVTYSAGTFTQEFIVTDQQGNARISFNNTGTGGTAKVIQENSYYAFGLVMPNSPVATPTVDNKQLYNGGSEWQKDYGNLPDYYMTFNRNYDAAIGRFLGVDPMAESAADMTSYQYAGNNPIMYNDPLGDAARPAPDPGISSPTIHLHNGVYDQLMGDMAAFESNAGYVQDGGGGGPVAGWGGEKWYNSGMFDDEGPFSSDKGRAGRAFWLGAEMSGGALDPASGNISKGTIPGASLPPGLDIKGILLPTVTVGDITSGKIRSIAAKALAAYQGGFIELHGQRMVDGHFYDVNMVKNDYQGVVTIGASDVKYQLLAQYGVKRLDNTHWLVSVSAFYIGPIVENMWYNTLISEGLGGGVYQQLQELTPGSPVLTPDDWHYIGSAGYIISSEMPNFFLNVHVSVGEGNLAGNASGTGYLDFSVPVRRQ